jgi:hypothetical protein
METVEIPNWIKARQAKLAELSLERVEVEGQEFWKELLAKLKANTDGLGCLCARGNVAPFENANTGEWSCRVNVFNELGSRGMTYTDLFYRPRGKKIRSLTMEGESLTYSFWISPEGRFGVVPSDGFSLKTESEVANSIVEQMVDRTA